MHKVHGQKEVEAFLHPYVDKVVHPSPEQLNQHLIAWVSYILCQAPQPSCWTPQSSHKGQTDP